MEIRRVLVPVDFSEPSEAALRYALALAARFEAEVALVHVFQPPLHALPDPLFVPRPQAFVDLSNLTQKQLDDLAHRYSGLGVRLHPILAEGVPYVEIVRIARDGKYDLVVMATQGRTGIAHLLLGSVAERVVRTSPIPVLTVRAAVAEPAAPQQI